MVNYIVITKQYKDIRSADNAHFPDEWPAESKDYESLAAARKDYPNAPIFTVKDFAHYSAGLELAQKFKPIEPLAPMPTKPWWKFWGK